jgi:hypothetical protein
MPQAPCLLGWNKTMVDAGFVRRTNMDLTVDSICLRCFRTVLTARDEGELMSAEELHICSSNDDEVWTRAAGRHG